MENIFKNLLLLALPASGKSEVRKFLSGMDSKTRKNDLHIGEMVQLDDFPYVHMMRRIDEELKKMGQEYIFFHAPEECFKEPHIWGALIQLLNEDYHDMVNNNKVSPSNSAVYLLKRIDNARKKVGLSALFYEDENDEIKMPAKILSSLIKNLEAESTDLLEKRQAEYPGTLEGKTIVIEFARGGPDGASMPIPVGYEYSLKHLSPEILEDSAILYVWVTPEESRRKNFERGDPNDPGSILKHSVPIEVMMKDYGCDDIDYLIKISDKKGYLKVEAHGKIFYLPISRFDNRVDKTSFVRNDTWKDEEKDILFNGLKDAASELYAGYSKEKTRT